WQQFCWLSEQKVNMIFWIEYRFLNSESANVRGFQRKSDCLASWWRQAATSPKESFRAKTERPPALLYELCRRPSRLSDFNGRHITTSDAARIAQLQGASHYHFRRSAN